jgi:hypothetical protein
MARQGIPAFGYERLLEPGDTAAETGRRLLADSFNPESGISVAESVAYLGLCFDDLVARLGAVEAWRRYKRYGRHAFLPTGPLRRAIELVRPDVVVTTNSPKSERAALLAARELGVAAIYIEDLLGIHTGAHLEIVPAAVADRYCVGSEIAAENVALRYGVGRDLIRMTGNPAFDRLADLGPQHRNQGRRELGFGDEETVVAYMDPAATPPEVVARIAVEVARIPRSRFVVRRHPNNRATDASAYLAAINPGVTLAERISLDFLLMATDVVIAVASTTALEAVLVGRRVVQLGSATGIPAVTGDRAEDLPLYAYGAAKKIESLAELATAVQEVLGRQDDQLHDAISRLFVPPGAAADAIVDEMNALVTSRPSHRQARWVP